MNYLEIKGCLTNLSSYAEGRLDFEWITLPIDDDELVEVFKRLNIDNEHEYFFTDWQGFNLGEYVSISEANDIAYQIDELDEHEVNKLKAILEYEGGSIQEALEHIDNYEFYENMTLQDYARELVSDYDLPELALNYFDYESFANDLEIDGYTETCYGVLYC